MSELTSVSKSTDYQAAFQSFLRKNEAKDPVWIKTLRKNAFAHFNELGFPTLENEEWRYTNTALIAGAQFQFSERAEKEGVVLEKLELGSRDWHRLVFLNGFLSKEFSSLEDLPKGVKLENLSEAIGSDSVIAEQYLAKYAASDKDAFAALNTAFIHDGAFLYIPKGVVISKPIHLLFVSHSAKGELISQPRNLIIAGESSAATIIESYISLEDHPYFNNSVTEIVLSPNAQIDYYKDQKESIEAYHVGTLQVYQDQDSKFRSTSISLGARLCRNNLNVMLDAEGAECSLSGLYYATGTQHVDNHSRIDHEKPHGTSRQLYKGILDGNSHGVFSGKIFIHKDAQKTDSEQTNKNLLLSETAKADTKPQLEIFADDVKATHGAAIGQLEEEHIFYFKSRGMSEENARALLTFGFANELIEKIKLDPIRWELERIFWNRLQRKAFGGK